MCSNVNVDNKETSNKLFDGNKWPDEIKLVENERF